MKKVLFYMDNAWKTWIERAESALLLAKTDKSDDLFYEDLCFQLQQAAEKAIRIMQSKHVIQVTTLL